MYIKSLINIYTAILTSEHNGTLDAGVHTFDMDDWRLRHRNSLLQQSISADQVCLSSLTYVLASSVYLLIFYLYISIDIYIYTYLYIYIYIYIYISKLSVLLS